MKNVEQRDSKSYQKDKKKLLTIMNCKRVLKISFIVFIFCSIIAHAVEERLFQLPNGYVIFKIPSNWPEPIYHEDKSVVRILSDGNPPFALSIGWNEIEIFQSEGKIDEIVRKFYETYKTAQPELKQLNLSLLPAGTKASNIKNSYYSTLSEGPLLDGVRTKQWTYISESSIGNELISVQRKTIIVIYDSFVWTIHISDDPEKRIIAERLLKSWKWRKGLRSIQNTIVKATEIRPIEIDSEHPGNWILCLRDETVQYYHSMWRDILESARKNHFNNNPEEAFALFLRCDSRDTTETFNPCIEFRWYPIEKVDIQNRMNMFKEWLLSSGVNSYDEIERGEWKAEYGQGEYILIDAKAPILKQKIRTFRVEVLFPNGMLLMTGMASPKWYIAYKDEILNIMKNINVKLVTPKNKNL